MSITLAATTSPTARDAVKDVEDFEREIHSFLNRDQTPVGVTSLVDRAAVTRDQLIELADEGIALELNDELRRERQDHLVAAIANLTRFFKDPGTAAGMEYAAETLIDLEAIRHILRDGMDHEPLRTGGANGAVELSRGDAVAQIGKWLSRLTKETQAQLLGLDPRELNRWKSEYAEKSATHRAEMSVTLIGILRHSWTNEGVARWFDRRHPALDGKRPVEVIDDPDWELRLIAAAKSGRAQMAT